MNRYDRQISVAEFGVDGQKKLAAAKILVVGVGGLGKPCSAISGRRRALVR
jgi:molybdopterin/thiamine biosynthesis adenylyltransferase